MEYPDRKRLRLENFDYSSEQYYFVTICTKDRQPFLSQIVGNGLDRSVKLLYSLAGRVCVQHIRNIPMHFPGVTVNKFVVMPNHVHLIVVIGCNGETERRGPFPTLSTIVSLYKSGISRELGVSIWQKSFYDHIIRTQEEYLSVWQYIDENPACWEKDEFFLSEVK